MARSRRRRGNPPPKKGRSTEQPRVVPGRGGKEPSSSRRTTISLGFLLGALVFAAFSPALGAGFIWDDPEAVTDNEMLRTPAGLWRIWTEPESAVQGHYWPIVFTTFWLEFQLWGTNPAGYHFTNILIHLVNALLLWRLLVAMNLRGAWLAAALFALHPVQVESVAWVIERKNVLSGFFFLSAGIVFLRFLEHRRWNLYATALALFVCAMLSKSSALCLPFAITICLWWRQERFDARQHALALPFYAVGGLIALFDVRLVHGIYQFDFDLNFVERVFIAGRALVFYLGKLLWPTHLLAVYPRWEIDTSSFGQAMFPLAVGSGLVGLLLARRRIGRGPFAAAIFFCVACGPTLGFVDFGFMDKSYVADHFQYLAAIGPIALFAAGCATFLQSNRAMTVPLRTGLGALLLLLATLSFLQSRVYESVETLFVHTLATNPNSWNGHYNLGAVYDDRGEHDRAIASYQESLRINPNFARAHSNLGLVLDDLDHPDKAMTHYREAIRILDRRTEAWVPHFNLARSLERSGDSDLAIEHYEQALAARPQLPLILIRLGDLRALRGEFPAAVQAFSQALLIQPGDANIVLRLNAVEKIRNDLGKAVDRSSAADHPEQPQGEATGQD